MNGMRRAIDPRAAARRTLRRWAGLWRRGLRDERGQTALEWTLLLAAIAIPSYLVIRVAVLTLIAHYQMVTVLNGLPFP